MDLKTVLSKISPLQQLLEDINFQRTKELRNLTKDGKARFRIPEKISFIAQLSIFLLRMHFSSRLRIRRASGKHSVDGDFRSPLLVPNQKGSLGLGRSSVLRSQKICQGIESASPEGESSSFVLNYLTVILAYHFSMTQKSKCFGKIRKSCPLAIQTLTGKRQFT